MIPGLSPTIPGFRSQRQGGNHKDGGEWREAMDLWREIGEISMGQGFGGCDPCLRAESEKGAEEAGGSAPLTAQLPRDGADGARRMRR